MSKYIDKTGLTTLWAKIKAYVSNNIPLATASKNGGVKTGYTANGKNYPVAVDANGKAYVNVPWANTTYGVATASANGLMDKADKAKLDSFHAAMQGDHNPFIMTESGITEDYSWSGSCMECEPGSVDGYWFNGNEWENCPNIFRLPAIPAATPTAGGVMSPTDKAKLDGGVLSCVWDLRGKDASAGASWKDLDAAPLIDEYRPLVCIMDNDSYVATIPVSYQVGGSIYLWYYTRKTVDNKTTYVLTEVHLWYSSTDKKTNLAIITNPTI